MQCCPDATVHCPARIPECPTHLNQAPCKRGADWGHCPVIIRLAWNGNSLGLSVGRASVNRCLDGGLAHDAGYRLQFYFPTAGQIFVRCFREHINEFVVIYVVPSVYEPSVAEFSRLLDIAIYDRRQRTGNGWDSGSRAWKLGAVTEQWSWRIPLRPKRHISHDVVLASEQDSKCTYAETLK